MWFALYASGSGCLQPVAARSGNHVSQAQPRGDYVAARSLDMSFIIDQNGVSQNKSILKGVHGL